MNWQSIIKPGTLSSKSHPQYTQNTQNAHEGANSGDIEDIGDRVFPQKIKNDGESNSPIQKTETAKKHGSPAIPYPCQKCSRVETIDIQGQAVHGCLYVAEGDYSDGWRRISDRIRNCIWPIGGKWN